MWADGLSKPPDDASVRENRLTLVDTVDSFMLRARNWTVVESDLISRGDAFPFFSFFRSFFFFSRTRKHIFLFNFPFRRIF